MGMVVQHNITAMNSNRMLGITTSAQAKSTEKLSSGYKINRAADDAAGLSISEKMRKQIRGLTQASANAEDGISAVQTADGALSEVTDMLQRMNELAVKAANGTNSTSDRQSIQDEIDQLVTEIDRVAETTKFNETYLLKGDNDAAPKTDYQYKQGDVTSQELYYIDSSTKKVETLKAGTSVKELDANTTYFTKKVAPEAGVAIETAASAQYFGSQSVANKAGYYESTADGFVEVEKGAVVDTTKTYYTHTANSDGLDVMESITGASVSEAATVVSGADASKVVYDKSGNLLANGTTIDSTKIGGGKDYFSAKADVKLDLADSIAIDDIKKAASKDTTQLTDRDGNEIAANGLYRYFDENGKYKGGLYTKTGTASVEKEATEADVDDLINKELKYDTGALTLKLHVGADATTTNQISVDIDAMSAKSIGVDVLKGNGVTGADDTNARNAIETISAALAKVSEQRSALGAAQNRLEHTIKNLDNIVENTSAAESQIRDTDMASEMVNYSKNNILSQAGQSMLAQANQSNQGVLSLLG